MYAFTKSGRGRLSTFRTVATRKRPSNCGASCFQASSAFSGLRRKLPRPLSDKGLALWIGHIAECVGLCLSIESEIRVAGHAEIGCRVVREERMLLSLRVDMAVQAFRLTIE